jgi:ketosteroid isomerase-like protein
MSEVEDFLEATLPRLVEAEEALHNGDVEPRLAMWSRNDPVTLLGAAGMSNSGWDECSRTFKWLASVFSNCQEYRCELIAAGASGDLAYTVGLEHSVVSRNGAPPEPNTLRVTQVYRREVGEWKVVHRQGNGLGTGKGPAITQS